MAVQALGCWATDARAGLDEAKPRFLDLMGALAVRFETRRAEVAGIGCSGQSDLVDNLIEVFAQAAPPVTIYNPQAQAKEEQSASVLHPVRRVN
jgi:hypothetical protein